MAETRTFSCDNCGKSGAGSILPLGWIAGTLYPLTHVKKLGDDLRWAVTLGCLPSDNLIVNLTPLTPPANHQFLNEPLHFCSTPCAHEYIKKAMEENNSVLDQRLETGEDKFKKLVTAVAKMLTDAQGKQEDSVEASTTKEQ